MDSNYLEPIRSCRTVEEYEKEQYAKMINNYLKEQERMRLREKMEQTIYSCFSSEELPNIQKYKNTIFELLLGSGSDKAKKDPNAMRYFISTYYKIFNGENVSMDDLFLLNKLSSTTANPAASILRTKYYDARHFLESSAIDEILAKKINDDKIVDCILGFDDTLAEVDERVEDLINKHYLKMYYREQCSNFMRKYKDASPIEREVLYMEFMNSPLKNAKTNLTAVDDAIEIMNTIEKEMGIDFKQEAEHKGNVYRRK